MDLHIKHRLTKPRVPKSKGMVERFNGRIADVLRTHRFVDSEDLEQTWLPYVKHYNEQISQKVLSHLSAKQAMQKWFKSNPHLFKSKPHNQARPDRYVCFMKNMYLNSSKVELKNEI